MMNEGKLPSRISTEKKPRLSNMYIADRNALDQSQKKEIIHLGQNRANKITLQEGINTSESIRRNNFSLINC